MLLLEAIRAHVAPIQEQLQSGSLWYPGVPRPQLLTVFGDCVLAPMLPKRYRITPGAVLANESVLNGEGLLIVDALHELPLGNLHTVETTFAYCDVQPEITPQVFTDSLQRVAAFKKLKREKATAYDVSPVHHLRIFGARYAQLSDDQINQMLGYVFIGAGGDPQELHNQLYGQLRSDKLRPEHTPDAIVNLADGWVIVRQTRTSQLAVPRSTFSKFGVYVLGENTALWVYVLLNTALSQIQLRAPDLMRVLESMGRRPG
jgi:hypothetical protein